MTVKVVVAGGFDPLHVGHLDHIRKAKTLALDCYLIVIVQSDENLIKKKGYCFMTYSERAEIIKSLKYVNEVVKNIDNDVTCAETLRMIKPDLFAKGGDRTENNMPLNEIIVCREIGCKIVYRVGSQLDSSSKLIEEALKKIYEIKK